MHALPVSFLQHFCEDIQASILYSGFIDKETEDKSKNRPSVT